MKLSALALAALLALGLTACGKDTPQQVEAQKFAADCQKNPTQEQCKESR